MGSEFYYREVMDNEVEEEIKLGATKILDYCRKVLSLPSEVFIQWVKNTDRESFEIEKKLNRAAENLLGYRAEEVIEN